MDPIIQAAATEAAAVPAIAQAQPAPAPVAVAPAPAPVAAAPVQPATDQDPPWLPKRLERARDGGFKEAESKFKTEIESREAALAAARTEIAERDRVLTELAASTLESLDEKQRAAVIQIAGDKDARKQLETVKALKASGLLASQPAPAAQPAPLPAPASTSAAQPAPAPANPAAPNHAAIYEQLKKTQPIRAAQYRLAHLAEISKAGAPQS
jgi:2-oxoglutarate dehydrogenase E2 component (dihydrolipoamide succinyltransferase)